MPASNNSVKPREIRLGLVMYGGISLAIYINGVAREFYRAVRGESVYKLVKAFTDSDIVVDIISGTSAGGINGILLGYALCNDADFSTTASLWREAGDIGLLIRGLDQLGNENLSVLDGEGHYQRKLEDAFRAMDRTRPAAPAGAGEPKTGGADPSPVQELDLFITSTDVDGTFYTWFDAQGHAVDVKDHRAVFQLKYRAGRKNDFAPGADGAGVAGIEDHYRALSKLARMTSCFPVAFPPVRLATKPGMSKEDQDYRTRWEKPDSLVRGWGNIAKDESYFLDGGLLDNKPFTHTIREIFYRLADRAVERRLFYVEPDPELFDKHIKATRVNVVQAVQRALISIPGYESIADDLKLLTAHNEKIRRYERLLGLDQGNRGLALQAAAQEAENSLDQNSKAFLARMKALEQGMRPATANRHPGEISRYAMARLVTLSERTVRGILREDGHDRQIDEARQKAAANLYRMFDNWSNASDPEGDATLYCFDVYFRLRRLFHVLYACSDAGLEGSDADKLRQDVQGCIGCQIRLLEIIRAAMEKLVDDGEFRWQERPPEAVWETLKSAYQRLLDAGTDGLLPPRYHDDWKTGKPQGAWLGQSGLVDFYQRLFGGKNAGGAEIPGRIGELLKQLGAGLAIESREPCFTMLAVTDACERRMLKYFDGQAAKMENHAGLPHLKDTYEQFMALDADLFTLETFADLREKDVIKTVRISPRDARRAFCDLDLKRKVAGDAVFHFGGFFKKSWRANDILWGRLDAVCQLVETLLTPERVRAVVDIQKHRDTLQPRVARNGDLHPECLFPKALPESQEALARWFARLVSNHPAQREAAIAKDEWERHLTLLVESAQMEFLGAEVRNVMCDAVTEQMEWNAYRKTAGQLEDIERCCGVKKDKFNIGRGRFDPTTHALASEALADRALARLDDPRALKDFFENKYGVGSESITRDVPPWTLLEIVFRGLLVMQACLVYAVPEKWRDKVKHSAIHRLLAAVLGLFHGLVWSLCRSNRIELVVRWGLFALAAFTWALAWGWRTAVTCGNGEFSTPGFLLLALPTILLLLVFERLRMLGVVVAGAAFAYWALIALGIISCSS